MRLTPTQVDEFAERGLLFIPKLFKAKEMRILKEGFDAAIEQHAEGVQSGVQIAMAPHAKNTIFDLLARHPRLVEPAMQLLGDRVYVHRSKLHAKLPLTREFLPWHQDYKRWHLSDGMPAPRAISAALFLVDVTEFNGPIVFIPGSHREGMLLRSPAGNVDHALEYRHYDIAEETLSRLVQTYGLEAPKGPAGSAVLFDINVAHASGANFTADPRDIFLIAYNSVCNHLLPVASPREDDQASRCFDPIECSADDIFLKSRRFRWTG